MAGCAHRIKGSEAVFRGDNCQHSEPKVEDVAHLVVGDVGRPDLHAGGDPLPLARQLHGSLERLLELPDGVGVYPSHYAGSVCGRSLSGNPFSTIGFERRHNRALAAGDAEAFARALLADLPPAPPDQATIVAANKRGAVAVRP